MHAGGLLPLFFPWKPPPSLENPKSSNPNHSSMAGWIRRDGGMGGGNYRKQMAASLSFIASAGLGRRTAGMSTCECDDAPPPERSGVSLVSLPFLFFALRLAGLQAYCSGWYVMLCRSSCRFRDGGTDEALHSVVGLRREELHG